MLDRFQASRGLAVLLARRFARFAVRGRFRCVALGWFVTLGVACAADPPGAPNLLLVTLDTTRADRLGCYGYARDTSPNIDRLADDGVVYTQAYATSSWTLPAHASLLTGQFPWRHGARFDPEGPVALADAIRAPSDAEEFRARGLGPELPTLAQTLREAGFATGAIVAGPWMKRVFGLDRGFADYDDSGIDSVRGRLAASVTDAAIDWLDVRANERFFLFLNYYDPHTPYDDPAGHAERFAPPGLSLDVLRDRQSKAGIDARYDGEIRYVDDELGRVIDRLRNQGLYENTWIVVTADHGELLGEHGRRGHGRSLYEEEIRIPLVVKPVKSVSRGRRTDAPTLQTDLFALLISRLGVSQPAGDPEAATRGDVYAEVYPLERRSDEGDFRVLRRGRWKLHWNSRGQHLLFDLANDPGEQMNLVELDRAQLEVMQERLEEIVSGLTPAGESKSVELDTATLEALRNLGYLDGGRSSLGTPGTER